ncbi:MAG: heat-shock protein [Planctomycetaceae bacterium]|nr:heat-shock protein [Planctomycetaceae bacterium]
MTTTLSNCGPSGNLFDDLRRVAEGLFGDTASGAIFAPRVNIAETESGYEVIGDLPGMKPEDVNVEFRDGHLWITGERKDETEEEGKTFHRVERRFGQFRRIISLGNEVDGDKIEASYKDGVLTIHIPKVAAVQPKRIEVKGYLVWRGRPS